MSQPIRDKVCHLGFPISPKNRNLLDEAFRQVFIPSLTFTEL